MTGAPGHPCLGRAVAERRSRRHQTSGRGRPLAVIRSADRSPPPGRRRGEAERAYAVPALEADRRFAFRPAHPAVRRWPSARQPHAISFSSICARSAGDVDLIATECLGAFAQPELLRQRQGMRIVADWLPLLARSGLREAAIRDVSSGMPARRSTDRLRHRYRPWDGRRAAAALHRDHRPDAARGRAPSDNDEGSRE